MNKEKGKVMIGETSIQSLSQNVPFYPIVTLMSWRRGVQNKDLLRPEKKSRFISLKLFIIVSLELKT